MKRPPKLILGAQIHGGLTALLEYKREKGLCRIICHCKPECRRTVRWMWEKPAK